MPEEKKQKEQGKDALSPEKKAFPIIGIGTSAGGLEALEKFFSHVPPHTNMAFVVIQHLSPNHKSLMPSLLGKYTGMKVHVIEDGMETESGCIYLNPPEYQVALFHGALHLTEKIRDGNIWLPIDAFFRSLAEDLGKKAIGIVLSGTASDGTLGIRNIKEKGGIVMVQEPEDARYDGMPRSAIASGCADFILPVDKMPDQLIRYVKHPYVEKTEGTEAPDKIFGNHIQKILARIRTVTGHDFTHYKKNTVRRRVERRMAVHQLENISDYYRYLMEHPQETRTLFQDMLIGVTDFFRDPEAFEILEKQLWEMFARHPDNSLIRIWVSGCASGEEVYSVTMLAVEVMEKMNRQFRFQIFASDIDGKAIEQARKAVYPDSIAARVSPERLRRFFMKEGGWYRIKKQIREMIIFAVQNLIQDPPYSRIDLLCCRNLLIYLDSHLQKKIFPLLHYTMNPGGILFLGTSESIGEFTDLFAPADAKWKIYRRKESASDRAGDAAPLYMGQFPVRTSGTGKKSPDPADAQQLAEQYILNHYTPSGVLIDEQCRIHHFMGKTDFCLMPPSGKPDFNIANMAREGLKYKLLACIQTAFAQKKTAHCKGIRLKYNGGFRTVDLQVSPMEGKDSSSLFWLVLFNDISPPLLHEGKEEKEEGGDKGKDPVIANLEYELQSAREYLQSNVEELETSNEELRSGNEELQSVNEELQSANEELETSKEELQSTNEELITVNAELQKKVEELSVVNSDISNLLASTDIGTIFLDTALCIKRFTPAMTRIFNLIGTDIGRPVAHITTNIPFENLRKDALEVLHTLERQEKEIQDSEGKCYHLRISPYRTVENVIDGVVLTFADISLLKEKDQVLRESNDRLSLSLEFPGVGTSAWDMAKDEIIWEGKNHPLFENAGGKRTGTYRDFLNMIHPEDREDIRAAISLALKEEENFNLEYRVLLPGGRTRRILEKGRIYRNEQGKALRAASFCRDISEQSSGC